MLQFLTLLLQDLSSTNDLSIGIFTGDIPTQLSDDSLLDNTKSDDCPVPSDIDSPFEVQLNDIDLFLI